MKKLAFFVGLLIVLGGAIYGVLYLDKISISPAFQAQPIEFPKLGEAQVMNLGGNTDMIFALSGFA